MPLPTEPGPEVLSLPIYPATVSHFRRLPDSALLVVAQTIWAPSFGYTAESLVLCRELARRFASALESLRETERRQRCGCYGMNCSICDADEAKEVR